MPKARYKERNYFKTTAVGRCECGRGMKTDKNKGCAACNAADEVAHKASKSAGLRGHRGMFEYHIAVSPMTRRRMG